MGSDWSVSPGTGAPSTTYGQAPPAADVSAQDNTCQSAPANLSAAHSYVDLAGQLGWWGGRGEGRRKRIIIIKRISRAPIYHTHTHTKKKKRKKKKAKKKRRRQKKRERKNE